MTEVLALGDTLSARYQFRSAVDYYHFLLLHFVAAKTNVAFCQCCGRYFVPKTRSKTIYCDRILKDEKTCKHWGPILKHKLESQQNKVIQPSTGPNGGCISDMNEQRTESRNPPTKI